MAEEEEVPDTSTYTESDVRSLDWKEHIRMRPGMYIGKTGDGSSRDDGIYILIKETVDNAIDEFVMGHGKRVDIDISEDTVTIRDRGRGIPLGKLVECVSQINTGAKYDSKAFKKSVGLNGVGTKAVNALSSYFKVEAFRDGKMKRAVFERGELIEETDELETSEKNGTRICFVPDESIFREYSFRSEHVERLVRNYCYLNSGLNIHFNGERYYSQNGLRDLLEENLSQEALYPTIHLQDEDIEVAFTHTEEYNEEYYSFVNGQHTTQGGTHLGAFREAIAKTLKDFFKKDYDPTDVRRSIVAAVSVKILEPVFESQTKTKLGSTEVEPGGRSIRAFVTDFLKEKLDNYLHKNPETAEALQDKIQRSEKERKEMAGIRKLAKKRAKQASIHNKKLKDCKVHLNDKKDDERKKESTIFLTEGDSASGSITKARDVNTQAVFSLKGKPLNAYGLTKKAVYENEEFNLIQAALNIEDGIENLRYNRIILATDADVDGMHIRLLLLTFFLQFFPELVKREHVHILETPLYRVRNKKATHYCYDEDERREAIQKLGGKPEITRFKGLGEISPDEFKEFIRPDQIRTEPVILNKDSRIPDILNFYMGKNTPDRQRFIVDNLRVDKDLVDEEMAKGKK